MQPQPYYRDRPEGRRCDHPSIYFPRCPQSGEQEPLAVPTDVSEAEVTWVALLDAHMRHQARGEPPHVATSWFELVPERVPEDDTELVEYPGCHCGHPPGQYRRLKTGLHPKHGYGTEFSPPAD